MLFILILLFVLYFAAAIFCCIETSFTAVDRTWLREQATQGDNRAQLAVHLLEKASEFFCTVLLGTNILHVAIGTLVSLFLAKYLLDSAFGGWLKGVLGDGDLTGLVTTVITVPTLLLFSEIIPKALARAHANSFTLMLSRLLSFSCLLLKAPVFVLDGISSSLTRMVGGSRDGSSLGKVSRDDLRILAAVAAEQGLIPKESQRVMDAVLDLENRKVSSVMVPLFNVKSLPVTASVADVEHLAAVTGFTRFPVYGSRIDEIIGLVSLRECMFRTQDYESLDNAKLSNVYIRNLIDRNVLYIPETMTVNALMAHFRSGAGPMAVVVDEYGGMTGVITTEDLIAMLVGGIADMRNQKMPQKMIAPLNADVFDCDGRTDIRELERQAGYSIEADGFSTVAGLVLNLLDHIPEVNEKVEWKGYTIQVLEMQKHCIARLRFSRRKSK